MRPPCEAWLLRLQASSMKSTRLDGRFWLVFLAAALCTSVVHELGHWLAGELQGAEMSYSLNGVRRIGGAVPTNAGAILIVAAGPMVTIVQALAALTLVLLTRSVLAYPFLFCAAFLRWMAAAVTVFNPNDEARLSIAHGLGTWTLPAVVVTGLVLLTVIGSRALNLGWRANGLFYLAATAAATVIVGLDALLNAA